MKGMKGNYLKNAKMLPVNKRLLRILYVTYFCFLLGTNIMWGEFTYAQQTLLTLSYNNVELEEVFNSIRRQSEFEFFYNNDQVDTSTKTSVYVKDADIYEVMKQILPTVYEYEIKDRYVLISKAKALPPEIISIVQQQGRTVTGVVRDASGPVIGANVVVKGTTNGAVTDVDGKFSIENIPANAILQISYVGYISQEISVDNQSQVTITLREDAESLDEVVVVGYGTMRRRDVTGSVASLSSTQLKDRPIAKLDQALSGQLAGVQVMDVTGEPGADMLIRVRGVGSISAGSAPLYVIDGFPFANLQTLNPGDIETIDVLKDASATAIYGSRGANGVVMITTKRGKEGQTRITADIYTGWQSAMMRPEFFNSKQQSQYYYDGVRNENTDLGIDVSLPYTEWGKQPSPIYSGTMGSAMPQTPMDVLEGRNTFETDMLDEVLRNAMQTRYSISATGGTQSLKYSISGEYLDQDGIVLGTDFKRYSFSSNFDVQLKHKLSLKLNFRSAMTDVSWQRNSDGGGGNNWSVIAQATSQMPYYPAYNEDGSYYVLFDLDASTVLYNALAVAKERLTKRNRRETFGNANLNYIITDGLNINFNSGAILTSFNEMIFTPGLPVFNNNAPSGSDASEFGLDWNTETTLNFDKSIKNHNFKALLGFATEKTTIKSSSLSSDRFPNNLVQYLSAVSGIITDGTSALNEYSLISYFGRINYNYSEKYYLSASLRTDGSSRFGSNHKYGWFPSASAMWRVSEEGFLKDVPYLSQLRLKLTYGVTGNNNIGNYDHLATVNYVRSILGNVASQGYAPARLYNPDLTWEKQQQINAGVEVAFLNNRIGLTVDYYNSTNSDLLLNVNVPTISGFPTALQNIGEVKNHGVEFVLNTVNLQGDFNWSTNFNISMYRNKVTKLGPEGDPIRSGWNITEIGQPIGMFYGLLWDGIFQNQAELDKGPKYNPGLRDESRVGDIRFKDVSGPDGVPDGIITVDDYSIMGNPYPDFYYGMTNQFSYKNINLNIGLVGSSGADVLNRANEIRLLTRSRSRTLATQVNYWKSEADPGDGKTPRPNNNPTGGIRLPNQRHMDSGTFLRINTISFGYLFPKSITQKLQLYSLRIYATATNPFIFTDNTSFNPEVANSRAALEPGIDYNNYPIAKSFIFGLNLEF
ncbi:MAG: TonB-dependent receptor [Tannerella sp.]|jgi:TonB-linked SusC/RagA family outer membrane protein|nr:TonB-dependent receptor [Tannerella sp.]